MASVSLHILSLDFAKWCFYWGIYHSTDIRIRLIFHLCTELNVIFFLLLFMLLVGFGCFLFGVKKFPTTKKRSLYDEFAKRLSVVGSQKALKTINWCA